ncbi:hypothetical protein HDU67_008362 [Dinochytrium kinnereticum]|nr:hypothetical protein HDU67_008362 [Dinochytrium kinnereticum]
MPVPLTTDPSLTATAAIGALPAASVDASSLGDTPCEQEPPLATLHVPSCDSDSANGFKAPVPREQHRAEILDLLVVGAGPHSLALLSHLLERSPYAVVSEQEHNQRYHSVSSSSSFPSASSASSAKASGSPTTKQAKKKVQNSNHNATSSSPQATARAAAEKAAASPSKSVLRECCPGVLDPEVLKQRVMVIDANGPNWMQRWNTAFEAYEISHLRSPLFFHPDPFHPDALRSFAENESRKNELRDITHIVDSGCSRCRRKKSQQRSHFSANDRENFWLPSANLFCSFCESLVDRYFLHDIIVRGKVVSIDAHKSENGSNMLFAVTFENDETSPNGPNRVTVHARRVVTALGNTNTPAIPQWASEALAKSECSVDEEEIKKQRLVHALELLKDGKAKLPSSLVDRISDPKRNRRTDPVRLLVVGGGLTSAQLVDIGVRRGIDEVVLVSRSKLKTMQFDLSLDWIGRNSMIHHTKFWAEKDPRARRAMLLAAKNGGGSITPEYMTVLMSHVASKKLRIIERTEVSNIEWRSSSAKWCVKLKQEAAEEEGFDLVWLGTGAVLDVSKEKCLENIIKERPIEVVGGLPVLTKELQWPGLDLYMMSGYSALSIGPSAGNLHGGRIAAQRIASSLWSHWQSELTLSQTPNPLQPTPEPLPTSCSREEICGSGGCGRVPIAACLVDGYCPWHWTNEKVEKKGKRNGRRDLGTLAKVSGHFGNYWEALEVE